MFYIQKRMPIHGILLAGSRDRVYVAVAGFEKKLAFSDFWCRSCFLLKNIFLTIFSIKNKSFDINNNCA